MSAEHETYMAMAREILRRCMAEEDSNDIHTWIQEQLARMFGAEDVEGVLWWDDTFDYYDELLLKRTADALIPEHERRTLLWPWQSWNNLIDPLAPGMLAVIAAGDGMGKTMYAETIAEEWARQKNRIVFIHYELNHAVMMDRRYSRHARIPIRQLKSGEMTAEQSRKINEVHAKLKQWQGNITYQHSAGWTMERTVNRLRQLKADGLCDAVIVDYLEKNAASRRQIQLFGNNLYQREADNVEQLKNFAESTETPIVMLAQMNKAAKTGDLDRIDRTGMRGAGEKSEKANVVVLLHREWDDINRGYSPLVDVRIDKNTLGPTGALQQMMIAEFFSVHDIVEG